MLCVMTKKEALWKEKYCFSCLINVYRNCTILYIQNGIQNRVFKETVKM